MLLKNASLMEKDLLANELGISSILAVHAQTVTLVLRCSVLIFHYF